MMRGLHRFCCTDGVFFSIIRTDFVMKIRSQRTKKRPLAPKMRDGRADGSMPVLAGKDRLT